MEDKIRQKKRKKLKWEEKKNTKKNKKISEFDNKEGNKWMSVFFLIRKSRRKWKRKRKKTKEGIALKKNKVTRMKEKKNEWSIWMNVTKDRKRKIRKKRKKKNRNKKETFTLLYCDWVSCVFAMCQSHKKRRKKTKIT